MKNNNKWDFFSIIGLITCVAFIVMIVYVGIHRGKCVAQGHYGATVNGCYDIKITK